MKQVLFLFLLLPLSLFALTFGDYTYTDNGDGTCAIDKYSGKGTALKIPAKIKSLSVTSLGNKSFEHCLNLVSVKIPASVRLIGDYSFGNCYDLKSITLPQGVTSLGTGCFLACSSLKSISIPEGVTSLGDRCFAQCLALKNITLPKSLTSLSSGCFMACSSLESITIPKNVLSLGSGCFLVCSSLKRIIFEGDAPSGTLSKDLEPLAIYYFEGKKGFKAPKWKVHLWFSKPKWQGYPCFMILN